MMGWDGLKRVANVALDRCNFTKTRQRIEHKSCKEAEVIPANFISFELITLEVGDNEKMGTHD